MTVTGQTDETSLAKKSSVNRIVWLDFAKSYGMTLVFLGHILESFYSYPEFASVFLPYKAIYSFNMPLFFLLSGYLSKIPTTSFKSYLRVRLPSRVVPFLFFNLIVFGMRFIIDFVTGEQDFLGHLRNLLALLGGVPVYNITTWFLACLLSVEVIHFIACRFFKTNGLRLLIALVLFGLGWLLTLRYRELVLNLWLFPEAMVAYVFYALGSTLKHLAWFSEGRSSRNLAGFFFNFTIMILTFSLNQTLFVTETPIVYMGLSSHGHPLLFLITAITGSLAIIYFAILSASSQRFSALQTRLGIQFIGLNTLILLGLNGMLMPVNYKVTGWLATFLLDQPVLTLSLAILLTIISLLLCVPVVLGIKRYLPQFVGLPRRQPMISKA
jgi:acyltransferase